MDEYNSLSKQLAKLSEDIQGLHESKGKVGLVHIQPGRPMQNEHVESFHGRLRDECLNASWFRTLNDVRSTLASWRREYNCERPHSSLGYRTPEEFRLKAGYADVDSNERFALRTASTTTAARQPQSKTKTEKLQLSVDEKPGAGQPLPQKMHHKWCIC